MTHRGRRILVPLLITLLAVPAFAQQDDRINQLEKKLDELLRQAESIRTELQQLKGETAAPADDLTKVDVAPAAPEAPPPASIADVKPVENTASPSASKALNPDISVIGNFIGHAGDENPTDPRDPLALDEAELALEAFIDPYAKGKFFISVGPEGAEVEEGYAQFVTLPWGLTAKAGKTKAMFGKDNTWHTHQRPWVDQPMVIARFFGDEGVSDVGVSVSKSIANPFGFVEATGEVYGGNVDGVFERQSQNDLLYNAHLKLFKDITENSNVEVGTSWMRGGDGGVDVGRGGHNQFTGVDLTYRWKPLEQSLYKSFIARFEGIADERNGDTLYGFYAAADYQLGQRWHTGIRLDSADNFGSGTDRGAAATLTFWPSEFSQIRGQLRRTQLEHGPSFNELLLQLQFSIGAHGAHTF
jgi:hypothetical protein